MASRLTVENLLEENVRSSSSVSSEVLCAAHGGKLKLFCLDEEQPVCVVCRDSEKHAGHKFIPVDEAVKLYKQKVRESLQPLKEKLKVFDKVKTDHDKTEDHIKVQARNTETQIKEQFESLRRVLQEEEEARMAALREEVGQKSQEMKEKIEGLTREMETLSNAIQAAEDQLRSDDHVSFLQNYKTTMKRVQLPLQDPPPLSGGALIDQAKHLMNLTFRVWDKMKHIVSYTPVTLDPNTASPSLTLSDDLTSVSRAGEQQLPDNPEKIQNWFRVLGSEGFNSGSHSWDVEVGDHGSWAIGVCVESNQRKGVVLSGYWFITLGLALINSLKYFTSFEVDSSSDEEFFDDSDDDYDIDDDDDEWTILAVNQNEMTRFSVNQKPRRIRVQLDWDRGQLSFSDPDSDTCLHTFTHTFTERLFPFVGTSHGDDRSLKMLPGKICVTLENHN